MFVHALCYIVVLIAKKHKILVFDDQHVLVNENNNYFITRCSYTNVEQCNSFICTLHSIFSGREVKYAGKDNLCKKMCAENENTDAVRDTKNDSDENKIYEMKVRTHQSGELVKIPTDFIFDGMIHPKIKGVIVLSDYGMGRIIIH